MYLKWTKATWAQRATILRAIESATGFVPNPTQLKIIQCDNRLRLTAGGERAGKTFTASVDAVTRLPFGKLFWIVGPDYDLPRREFMYIYQLLDALGAIKSEKDVSMPKEGRWQLKTKSGQVVMTRTSSDVRKLAADPVDGFILTEVGQGSLDALYKAYGRVSETRGWIHGEGTFEGAGTWYPSVFTEIRNDPDNNTFGGRAFSLPAWSNTAIFPGGRTDPAILDLETAYSPVPHLFDERVAAIPAPPLGVIFREFSVLHHVSPVIKYDSSLPVYLAIDPGHGGPSAYAVAAIQILPDPSVKIAAGQSETKLDPIDYMNVIDCIYLPTVQTEAAVEVAKRRVWWDNVVGGVIDIEAPDERTRWFSLGGVSLVSRKVPIIEGERRMHYFLAYDPDSQVRPHIMFSSDVPEDALLEFTKYKTPDDTVIALDDKAPAVVKQRRGPEHMLKALWYFMYIRYGAVKVGRPSKPSVLPVVRRLMNNVRTRQRSQTPAR